MSNTWLKTAGAWVPHRFKMLQSPTWAALSAGAKKILERIEIEYMRHAGKNNGEIICTYQDFAAYGIRRKSISPGIQKLVELGFLEVTKPGWLSPDHSAPSRYRLTYLPTAHAAPSDEWLKVEPSTRNPMKSKSRSALKSRPKIQITGGENAPSTRGENAPPGTQESGEKLGAKTPLLSILLSTAAPQEGREREDDSLSERQRRAEAGMAMAAMAELPVPFASGVLRRRRNRLLSTTMLTPRHATGGEIRNMQCTQ